MEVNMCRNAPIQRGDTRQDVDDRIYGEIHKQKHLVWNAGCVHVLSRAGRGKPHIWPGLFYHAVRGTNAWSNLRIWHDNWPSSFGNTAVSAACTHSPSSRVPWGSHQRWRPSFAR